MELDTIGDEKTVLFLIMSDTDTTFNFILAMLQSQLINLLCDRADDKYGGRLPVHVRLILDEFANIGQIPNFDKLIATIRSREISASIILQSQSQLKAIYKDAAEIISDNCDSVLFLSGRGKNAKEISDALGKETIDSFNTSENRGSQTSHGLNYQKLGKSLPQCQVVNSKKDKHYQRKQSFIVLVLFLFMFSALHCSKRRTIIYSMEVRNGLYDIERGR